jgi:hypothetical protein
MERKNMVVQCRQCGVTARIKIKMREGGGNRKVSKFYLPWKYERRSAFCSCYAHSDHNLVVN